MASGARAISVCQYDAEQNWWVAKHIKKPLRTTVLSLEWHPNSVLLAAGGADGVARVFSAFMKGVDAKFVPSLPRSALESKLTRTVSQASSFALGRASSLQHRLRRVCLPVGRMGSRRCVLSFRRRSRLRLFVFLLLSPFISESY